MSRSCALLLLLALAGPQEKQDPPADPAKFELLRSIEDHSDGITRARFTRNGRYLVTAARDGVRVWDVAKRTILHSIPGVGYFALDPNDDRIAILDPVKPNVIHIYEIDKGRATKKIETDTGGAGTFAYLPDGKNIVVLSGAVSVWDSGSGKKVGDFFKEIGMVDRFFFGKKYGAFIYQASVRLFDLASGRLAKEIVAPKIVDHAAIDASSKYLATASGTSIKLWDISKGKEALSAEAGGGSVMALAFSPNGKILAVSTSEKKLILYAVEKTLREIKSFEPHVGHAQDIAFAPDGKTLLTAGSDRRLRMWDAATGEPAGDFGVPYEYFSLAVSADGKLLYVGDPRGRVTTWNLETGMIEKSTKTHENTVLSIAAAPGGKHVVTTGQDRTMRVWDTTEWKEVRKIGIGESLSRAHATETEVVFFDGNKLARWGLLSGDARVIGDNKATTINAFALSADGKRAVYLDRSNVVLCDVEAGKVITAISLTNYSDSNKAAMNANGSMLAFLLEEGSIYVAAGDEIKEHAVLDWRVKDKRSHITSNLAMSADGRFLAAASFGTVIVWSLEKKALVKTFAREGAMSERIRQLAWLPDGKALVALTDRGGILIWGRKK